jgi:hypothetical protein
VLLASGGLLLARRHRPGAFTRDSQISQRMRTVRRGRAQHPRPSPPRTSALEAVNRPVGQGLRAEGTGDPRNQAQERNNTSPDRNAIAQDVIGKRHSTHASEVLKGLPSSSACTDGRRTAVVHRGVHGVYDCPLPSKLNTLRLIWQVFLWSTTVLLSAPMSRNPILDGIPYRFVPSSFLISPSPSGSASSSFSLCPRHARRVIQHSLGFVYGPPPRW